MNSKEFSKYRHEATHALMGLNDQCDREFRILSWPHWDYELEIKTLTFSQEGIPKIVASIQVVGTTSEAEGTWLWGWANKYLPEGVTKAISRVREFGLKEQIPELIEASLPDNEYLGWEMTAVAAQVLGAKGAYRCPGDDGFIYFIYTDLAFAEVPSPRQTAEIECRTHGVGYQAFVCEHLISNPSQEWFSEEPNNANPWPDAWCTACEGAFQRQGEWNDQNSSELKIKLVCHHCYERLRSQAPPTDS